MKQTCHFARFRSNPVTYTKEVSCITLHIRFVLYLSNQRFTRVSSITWKSHPCESSLWLTILRSMFKLGAPNISQCKYWSLAFQNIRPWIKVLHLNAMIFSSSMGYNYWGITHSRVWSCWWEQKDRVVPRASITESDPNLKASISQTRPNNVPILLEYWNNMLK